MYYYKMMNTEENVLSKVGNKYQYNRVFHPELSKLSDTIKNQYDKKECVITTSGMQSISLTINGILAHHNYDKFNVIYGHETYCDTPRLFQYIQKVHKIT